MEDTEGQGPTEESRADNKALSLYQSSLGVEVLAPNPPNIPLQEGIHIQVAGKHDSTDAPKEVLTRYLFGLAVAKADAESGVTKRDYWANTRLEKNNEVSVYGRSPEEDASWRKPVNTNKRGVADVSSFPPYYNKLGELFTKYLPKWEVLAKKMKLFDKGVNGRDNNQDFPDYHLIWGNDKFDLIFIKKAHLKGYHLVVNPKREYWEGKDNYVRQWQTVRESGDEKEMIQEYLQGTLEATAIAMGARELILPGEGELHNSGNWAGGLKTREEGGNLELPEEGDSVKSKKRQHRPDLAKDKENRGFGTGMHVHVYIPEGRGDRVDLPAMSIDEANERRNKALIDKSPTKEYDQIIEQWNNIPHITNEQSEKIISKLGSGKLTKWLDNNCQGDLLPTQNSV